MAGSLLILVSVPPQPTRVLRVFDVRRPLQVQMQVQGKPARRLQLGRPRGGPEAAGWRHRRAAGRLRLLRGFSRGHEAARPSRGLMGTGAQGMSRRAPPAAEERHGRTHQSVFLQIHRKLQVIYFKMLSFILKYIYIYVFASE